MARWPEVHLRGRRRGGLRAGPGGLVADAEGAPGHDPGREPGAVHHVLQQRGGGPCAPGAPATEASLTSV